MNESEISTYLKSDLKKPSASFGRWIWFGWIVFIIVLVIQVSKSLQPRMPGMPASGGYLNAPSSMQNMPGMGKP